MKGLHSGVFFLAGNFINYSAFRILRIQMFYRVESESFQIKGFKIDTKKWATEINKIYVSVCWQENSPRVAVNVLKLESMQPFISYLS